MNCYVHAQTEAVGYCVRCGKGVCQVCMNKVNGKILCDTCASKSSAISQRRLIAAILGIVVGGLGIHKFYLGRVGQGILYILFCWTGIPSLIGLIEGILYLVWTDEQFAEKYPNIA
ncbi:MAG: NINE protein [Mycobacterium leprae]